MLDPRLQTLPLAVWELLALASICVFFAAVGLTCLCIRIRRRRMLAAGLILVPVCYLLMQGFLSLEPMRSKRGAAHAAVKDLVLNLPSWALISVVLGLGLVMGLLWLRILRDRRCHISPMSVKEAMDNLPTGICCYAPGGRIVLQNRAMETLTCTVAGEIACNGETLSGTLTEGVLAPGCKRGTTDGGPILVLPDGSARALSIQKLEWESGELTALLAADVTEAYQKTLSLEEKQAQLCEINRKLAGYNREIVDLTIQAEILAARARLHDEIGTNLLVMKKLLRRGIDQTELLDLRRRLQRSISCLKEDSEPRGSDELTVLLETARRLGVRMEIDGEVPQEPALAHVITTGLHECLTNLLRHARGDTLRLSLRRESDRVIAEFSGNGDPPVGEIREAGGLRILRATAEEIGGSMTVSAAPDFRVRLELPKEVQYAL